MKPLQKEYLGGEAITGRYEFLCYKVSYMASDQICLSYESLRSKTHSLSFQNLVTFFIDSLIDSLIIWTTAKSFQNGNEAKVNMN